MIFDLYQFRLIKLNFHVSLSHRRSTRVSVETINLCAIKVPVIRQYLFGDDVAKQLKDVRETSKISRSVENTSFKKYSHGSSCSTRQNHRGGFSNYRSKSQTGNFFMEEPIQTIQTAESKGPKNRQQIIEQLKEILECF